MLAGEWCGGACHYFPDGFKLLIILDCYHPKATLPEMLHCQKCTIYSTLFVRLEIGQNGIDLRSNALLLVMFEKVWISVVASMSKTDPEILSAQVCEIYGISPSGPDWDVEL